MDPSEPLSWQIPIFAAGDRTVNVRDVITAAILRGELDDAITTAQASGDRDVQALCDTWRYERDLITAEETERWLEARGVTLRELYQFIGRQAGRSDESSDLSDSGPALRERVRIEALLSGAFDRLALRLSWRFAAWIESSAETHGEDRRAAQLSPPWECDARWLDEMLSIESTWRREKDALLTPAALNHALAALRLQLTRIEFDALEVDSLDAAREALLCIREDGLLIADVAREGGYPHSRYDLLFNELSEEWQRHFLSATPGASLPPLERGGGFCICHLIRRSEPTLADERIRKRVEQHLITQHFSELAAMHIRWLLFPPPVA